MPLPVLHTRTLSLFYRQLCTLVHSGMPFVEAMDLMSRQNDSASIRGAAAKIKQYSSEGHTLSEGLSQFPDIFPAWQVNLVKYSETAGRLDDGLEHLADAMEKDHADQQKIIVGLAYPFVLLNIALFILPIINSLKTQVGCGGMSGYIPELLKTFFLFYGSIALIYFSFSSLGKEKFKNVGETIALSIPGLGGLIRQISILRFIRALQCLVASGVSISTAWKLSAEACDNSVVKTAILKGLNPIEQGEALSKAFIQAGVFNLNTIGMITTAEKSGSLVQVLDTVATYAKKDTETAIAVFVRVLPIFFYLAVAGFIAFQIISFYNNYFGRLLSY